MERKDFFKKLGIGLATVAVAPRVLAGIRFDTEEKLGSFQTLIIDKGIVNYLKGERELTLAFLNYLRNKEVSFKWKEITSPLVEISKPEQETYQLTTKTRKLTTTLVPNMLEDRDAMPGEEVFRLIEEEIQGWMDETNKEKIILIHSLSSTPLMYNPIDFTPVRGFLMRYTIDRF